MQGERRQGKNRANLKFIFAPVVGVARSSNSTHGMIRSTVASPSAAEATIMAPVGRTEAGRPGKLGISPRHSNVLGQSRAIASRSGKPGDRRNNLLRVSGPSHLLARAEVSAAAALAEHGTSPAIKVAPISREQQPALRPLSGPVRYASEGKPLSRRYVAPSKPTERHRLPAGVAQRLSI